MRELILITLIFISLNLFGQSNILENCEQLKIITLDDSIERRFMFKEFSEIYLVTHKRENDFFKIEDTLKRDYIKLNGQKIIIDSVIGLIQSNYTVSFDLLYVFSLNHFNSSFLFFLGSDVFPNGSEQELYYIIIRKINGKWHYLKCYEAKKMSTKTKIRIRKNNISLKARELKKIKRISKITTS